MKTIQRKASTGFTLIELMAVIAIIVILAGLVVGGLGFVYEKQASSKAKVQIALISKALEEYKLDNGTYPPTEELPAGPTGIGQTANLYKALFYEGYDYNKQSPPPTTWTKRIGTVDFPQSTRIYLADLDPTSTKQGWVDPVTGTTPVPPPSTTIKDPWGNEYRYRTGKSATGSANASTQNPDFDLWSAGKDGQTNTAIPTDKTNRDDIKNF